MENKVIQWKVKNKNTGQIKYASGGFPIVIPYWFIIGNKSFSKRSWYIIEEPWLRYWMAQHIIDSMSNGEEGLVIRDIVSNEK